MLRLLRVDLLSFNELEARQFRFRFPLCLLPLAESSIIIRQYDGCDAVMVQELERLGGEVDGLDGDHGLSRYGVDFHGVNRVPRDGDVGWLGQIAHREERVFGAKCLEEIGSGSNNRDTHFRFVCRCPLKASRSPTIGPQLGLVDE